MTRKESPTRASLRFMSATSVTFGTNLGVLTGSSTMSKALSAGTSMVALLCISAIVTPPLAFCEPPAIVESRPGRMGPSGPAPFAACLLEVQHTDHRCACGPAGRKARPQNGHEHAGQSDHDQL